MGPGGAFDVKGQAGDPIFDGLNFSLQGGDGAGNQAYADSFVPTGHFVPHFDHNIAAWYERYVEALIGDQTLEFEICVDTRNQNVAKYDLRVWGQ